MLITGGGVAVVAAEGEWRRDSDPVPGVILAGHAVALVCPGGFPPRSGFSGHLPSGQPSSLRFGGRSGSRSTETIYRLSTDYCTAMVSPQIGEKSFGCDLRMMLASIMIHSLIFVCAYLQFSAACRIVGFVVCLSFQKCLQKSIHTQFGNHKHVAIRHLTPK